MKGRGEKDPFRKNTEELIEIGDLKGLREKTGEFHGHFCAYSACGVKAGYIAMRELGIKNILINKMLCLWRKGSGNACESKGW